MDERKPGFDDRHFLWPRGTTGLAENTDMAEDLDNIDGSGFWGHFFFFFFVEKSQSYRWINTVTAMDRTRLIPEEKKYIGNCGKKKKKNESRRFLRVGQSTANLQKFKDGLSSSFTPKKPNSF